MHFFRQIRATPIRAVIGALSVAVGFLYGAGARADPAMWVIKDADSTVYLLGTIHVMKPGVSWRSEKLDAALNSSDEYWMEADVAADPAIAQTYALNFGMDSRHPLSEAIGAANYAKLLDIAQRYQIPTERFPQMRPWLATMALSRAQILSLGYDPDLGVDRTLEKAALAAGKPVKTFETISEQLDFLAGMPDKLAAQMLVEALDDLKEGVKVVDSLEAAWLAGDVKQLQQAGNERMRKDSPELYDRIVVQRNRNWAKRIDAMLKGSGTQFIAVGAAHLLGGDSLPAQLTKLGYKVERY
jgi:uncharacterized protein YbaP (TraB family)